MSRRLIAASSVLSLAACVAGPVHKSATAGQDGTAVTPARFVVVVANVAGGDGWAS